jgi:membrane protease YdiL (CAAX protease family)
MKGMVATEEFHPLSGRRKGIIQVLAICIIVFPSFWTEAFTGLYPAVGVGRQQSGLPDVEYSVYRVSTQLNLWKSHPSILVCPPQIAKSTCLRRAPGIGNGGIQAQSLSLTQGSNVENVDDNDDGADNDDFFDLRTTAALVGGQSALIALAAIVGLLVGTPNYGFGPDIDFSGGALLEGILWTAPLGVIALGLDLVEDRFPALQDVTRATQRSVLNLLGGTFKPIGGLLTAACLGLAAGLGEELLFRGIFQYELLDRFDSQMIALGTSSIVFGALHAVTPLYAILASLASLYFGWLYLLTGNLAVPISTHAFYDWVALLYAHYEVSQLTREEQWSLARWYGPMDPKNDDFDIMA